MRYSEELNIKDKTIIDRVDVNSPINKNTGKVQKNPRIEIHSKSILEISERGARVILLAHQGKKGEDDFKSLEEHADLISRETGKDIIFVDQVIGERVRRAIELMKPGNILLLENVRFRDDEITNPYEARIVKELVPHGDFFLLDALSVAHREHASVVGFAPYLPSAAGRVLKDELDAIHLVENTGKATLFLGGSKAGDSIKIMKKWLGDGKAKFVLVGGALATLFLYAKGYDIGESLQYLITNDMLKYVPEVKEILDRYNDNIVLPVDVAMNVDGRRDEVAADAQKKKGQIFDIGERTIKRYEEILWDSPSVILNGPAGVYEIENFSLGTKKILEAIAESKGFTLLGGGHTITAIERFGIQKEKFNYVSLSGKALIHYLSGKVLPGIKALEESAKRF